MTAVVVGPATHPDPVAAPADPAASARRPLVAVLPEATTLAAAAWFLVVVARGWGGRDARVVTVGAALLASAVLAVRPARVLPRLPILIATGLSVGALVVAAVSPTGWRGAAGGSGYVIAAWLTLVIAATVARRPGMAIWVAALVATAGAIEFGEAWLPWWGGQVPGAPMIGTFYWHDPFAAFLLPAAIVGMGLWVWQARTVAALGCLAFVLCTAGVIFSTSRAAIACLAVGALLTAVAAGIGVEPVRRLARAGVAVVLAGAASYALTGPPFFSHRASALAGVGDRGATQSLGQNGGYRLQFWHEAVNVFRGHPVTGGGYHSMAAESAGRVPHGWATSPFAHNGYLQALSDGGLVLAVPFLLGVAGLAVGLLLLLRRSLAGRAPTVTTFAVPLALGAALAHSAIDFDWTYVANLAMTAILGGLVLGLWAARRAAETPTSAPVRRRLAAAYVVAAVVTLALAGWGSWHGDLHENLPVNDRPAAAVVKAVPGDADSQQEAARTRLPSARASLTKDHT